MSRLEFLELDEEKEKPRDAFELVRVTGVGNVDEEEEDDDLRLDEPLSPSRKEKGELKKKISAFYTNNRKRLLIFLVGISMLLAIVALILTRDAHSTSPSPPIVTIITVAANSSCNTTTPATPLPLPPPPPPPSATCNQITDCSWPQGQCASLAPNDCFCYLPWFGPNCEQVGSVCPTSQQLLAYPAAARSAALNLDGTACTFCPLPLPWMHISSQCTLRPFQNTTTTWPSCGGLGSTQLTNVQFLRVDQTPTVIGLASSLDGITIYAGRFTETCITWTAVPVMSNLYATSMSPTLVQYTPTAKTNTTQELFSVAKGLFAVSSNQIGYFAHSYMASKFFNYDTVSFYIFNVTASLDFQLVFRGSAVSSPAQDWGSGHFSSPTLDLQMASMADQRLLLSIPSTGLTKATPGSYSLQTNGGTTTFSYNWMSTASTQFSLFDEQTRVYTTLSTPIAPTSMRLQSFFAARPSILVSVPVIWNGQLYMSSQQGSTILLALIPNVAANTVSASLFTQPVDEDSVSFVTYSQDGTTTFQQFVFEPLP